MLSPILRKPAPDLLVFVSILCKYFSPDAFCSFELSRSKLWVHLAVLRYDFFANNSFFSRLSKMTMILLRRMKPDPISLWCKARNWRSLILSCSRRSEKGRLAKCFKYICFHSFSPNFISFLGPPKGDWEDLCNEGDEQASHYRV